jgi:hypothetical protein
MKGKHSTNKAQRITAEKEIRTLTKKYNKLLESYHNLNKLALERQTKLMAQRDRVAAVFNMMYNEHCSNKGGMHKPKVFSVAEARCDECDGKGGRKLEEEELEHIRSSIYTWRKDGDIRKSLRLDTDTPINEYANPRACPEDWCGYCWGTGYNIEMPFYGS